jgi:hypothetical protein
MSFSVGRWLHPRILRENASPIPKDSRMTIPEDGIYDADAARRSRRRKQAVVGAAGLAALLGGGAFLFAETHDAATMAREAGSPAPAVTSPTTPTTAPSPRASTKARRPTADRQGTSPSPSKSKSAAERVAEARAAAAKNGIRVERPLTPHALPGATGPVTETNTGSLASGGTMRVTSARYDLTGQRELLWAADGGTAVGEARCTQNFHFTNAKKPRIRPTMLMCWRTSPAKSVITIAVVKQGRPSTATSVEALDAEWARLG